MVKYTLIVDKVRCNNCAKCEEYIPGLPVLEEGFYIHPFAYELYEEKVDKLLDLCHCDAITLRLG